MKNLANKVICGFLTALGLVALVGVITGHTWHIVTVGLCVVLILLHLPEKETEAKPRNK